MKKIALISAIAISGLLYNNNANAQVRIHVGLNFGPRPVVYYPASQGVVAAAVQTEYCEPANYDGGEDYYYLPEVDAYYSIPDECYYYNDGRQWVSAAYLPGVYRDFDWRAARRFEVRAPRPFLHADYYRERYNGAAINGRWDRNYNHAYASDNQRYYNHDQFRNDNQRYDNRDRFRNDNQRYDNHDQSRNDNQRYDNRNRRDYDHQFDHNREQNRNFDRMSAQQHFAQNNPQRNDWGERDRHRPGRF